jgi:hypothetical protein
MRGSLSQVVGGLLLWLAFGICGSAPAAGEERILTEGRIKGQPVMFVLDTGASLPLLLTPPAAAKLGITADVPPPAGVEGAHILAGFSKPVPIGLPPAFEPETVALGILAPDPQSLEWDVDAVIGWPALMGNRLLYEPGRNTLFGTRLEVDKSGWRPFPILDANVLIFDAGGEKPLPVMVDTGWSGGVMLPPPYWQAWRKQNPGLRHTLITHYSPAFGLVVLEQYLAPRMAIGGAVFTNVMVSEAPSSEARGNRESEAVLGLAAFANHALLVDTVAKQVFIRSSGDRPRLPSYNRLGATFLPATMAAKVAPGSPAAGADITDGDVLLKIDGLSPGEYASRLREHNVWEQPAGTSILLTLRRGNAEIERRVVLQDYLVP